MAQKIVVKIPTQPSSAGAGGGEKWRSAAVQVLQNLMKQANAQPFIRKEDWDNLRKLETEGNGNGILTLTNISQQRITKRRTEKEDVWSL
jgi:hypothetical protein